MIKQLYRQSLITEIESEILKLPEQTGLCLYIARHTLNALRKHGYNAVLQAGSMQWPIVRPEDDDGEVGTHFAYIWSPDTPTSRLAMALGALPEMHVWVGILDTQEVVDFSTKFLRKDAESRGITWGTDDPPEYLWSHRLPEGVRYIPDKTATLLALELIEEIDLQEKEQEMKEPTILVNGVALTNTQAMTLRVALQTFLMNIESDEYLEAIKDDSLSQQINDGYIRCGREITKIMGA